MKENFYSCIGFWVTIGASDFVQSTIRTGFRLPFLSESVLADFRNNRSALAEVEFVTSSIVEMLEGGYIVECPSRTKVVNPLSVAVQSSGKKRLICDFRHDNEYVEKRKFKMDDLKVAKIYLEKNSFLTSFDIRKGYYHIDICAEHQDYLAFSWVFARNRMLF